MSEGLRKRKKRIEKLEKERDVNNKKRQNRKIHRKIRNRDGDRNQDLDRNGESVMYLSSCLSPSLASASPPVVEDGFPLSSSAFSLQVTSNIK